MPRHPPCALHSLSHTPPTPTTHQPTTQGEPANPHKVGQPTGEGDRRCTRNTPQRTNTHPTQSAGRMHKTKRNTPTPTDPPQGRTPRQTTAGRCISRCSRPLSRSQTTTPHHTHTPHHGGTQARPGPCAHTFQNRSPRLTPDSSEPQQCAPTPDPPHEEPRPPSRGAPGVGRCRCSTAKQHQPPPHDPTGTAPAGGDEQVYVLLRKEVIQPHLPVRLPCYDFVPIASPTFDHSPR
jgi:hypothetical protein